MKGPTELTLLLDGLDRMDWVLSTFIKEQGVDPGSMIGEWVACYVWGLGCGDFALVY